MLMKEYRKNLKKEINELDFNNVDGFKIPKGIIIFLIGISHTCGWDNDYQLRLFRKSKVSVTERLVHEGFEINGNTLKSSNLH